LVQSQSFGGTPARPAEKGTHLIFEFANYTGSRP
jgi:hypothetical protein